MSLASRAMVCAHLSVATIAGYGVQMRAIPLLFLVAGCTLQAPPPAPHVVPPPTDLAAVFDCLRERRLALVSAHRGQADPSKAENVLSSFAETVKAGPILIELDIGTTADGGLVLLHDDTLDRTTEGSGPLAARTLAQVRTLRVKDAEGRLAQGTVPMLEEALLWAKRAGALLQLDVKRGTAFEAVIASVRKAQMADRVIVITYNLADAKRVQALAPEMMLSASGRNADEIAAMLAMGNRRLLGFTGLGAPTAETIARMDAARVEAITGTLGAAGKRLDDSYMADGDGGEYAELAARGTALIASDRPLDAWAALQAAGRSGETCLTGDDA